MPLAYLVLVDLLSAAVPLISCIHNGLHVNHHDSITLQVHTLQVAVAASACRLVKPGSGGGPLDPEVVAALSDLEALVPPTPGSSTGRRGSASQVRG